MGAGTVCGTVTGLLEIVSQSKCRFVFFVQQCRCFVLASFVLPEVLHKKTKTWPNCGKTQVPGTKYHTTFVMVFKLESATSPAVEFEFTIVREFVRFSLIYLFSLIS